MMKITQEMFADFPVVDGVKQCPSGDYTEIKSFGEGCSFGESCSFGAYCSFGEGCSFGMSCSFEAYCSFGESCSFGMSCSFGEGCSFGECCGFGESCSFGAYCSFGESCSFGKSCMVEGDIILLALRKSEGLGRESRCTYFILSEEGKIYVRCGSFFGDIEGFKEAVRKTHAGTRHEADYLDAAEQWEKHFARLMNA